MLEKVRDLFLRDAATAEELRMQEIQDHMASSASLHSGLSRSGRELMKKRTPQSMSRTLLDLGGEGSTIPVGSEDEQNAYIALGLPIIDGCVTELLRGPPGPRGEEAGSGSGSGSHSLLPEYVLRLSEDGQVTAPTQLSAQEMHRRRLLADTKYKVVLNVNGRAVTHSEPVDLRLPTLTADFKQYFELRLIHEPTELSVDIYGVSGGVIACLTKGKRHKRSTESYVRLGTMTESALYLVSMYSKSLHHRHHHRHLLLHPNTIPCSLLTFLLKSRNFYCPCRPAPAGTDAERGSEGRARETLSSGQSFVRA